MPKRILVVAEHRYGHGSGHMHRCSRLVRDLHGSIDWLLPEAPAEGYRSRSEMLDRIGNVALPVRWIDTPAGPYDLVILDKREADLHELRSLGGAGIVVGIDLAGEARDYCSYLIDTLPTPPGQAPPNIADPGLLHLPDTIRERWPEEVHRVLVVFGGESTGERAIAAAEKLTQQTGLEVTAAVRKDFGDHPTVNTLKTAGELPEYLAQFDCVVTHFGLTAYEALWARVPVVCINPSSYHDELSDLAGFVRTDRIESVPRLLQRFDRLVQHGKETRPSGRSDPATLINSLAPPPRFDPPTGGDRFQPAIERYGERTFFRNERDGMVYQQNFRGVEVRYNHDYFFQEYRDQYGRTYLEDFENIAAVGARRIADIKRVHGYGTSRKKLLDIGCAYGPFLTAATRQGYRATGIDVSCDAVEYAKNELGLDAVCGDILEVENESLGAPFDIVTMWYVIEHFADLDRLLDRVRSLLVEGGIFAFSTPNGAGISGRTDRREFLRRSPDDHYTIWDPPIAKQTLRNFGFSLRRIRITGHHPERFENTPFSQKALDSGPIHTVIGAWSRLRGLGDTFEVIAEAVR